MAAFLPAIIPSPFSKAFSRKPYLLGDSPYAGSATVDSSVSIGTICVNRSRKISSTSYLSASSTPPEATVTHDENQEPQRKVSAPTFKQTTPSAAFSTTSQTSQPISHRSQWGTEILVPPKSRSDKSGLHDSSSLEDISISAAYGATEPAKTEDGPPLVHSRALETPARARISINESLSLPEVRGEGVDENEPFFEHQVEERASLPTRWMNTLKRRKQRELAVTINTRTKAKVATDDVASVSTFYTLPVLQSKHGNHSSTTSSGFVRTVKTASCSAASLPFHPRSKRNSHTSDRSRFKKGSGLSSPALRFSIDSDRTPTISSVEEHAYIRGTKRRQVFSTMLASTHAVPGQGSKWSSIQRNLMEMLHLHENLLSQLQRCITGTRDVAKDVQPAAKVGKHLHIKWHSFDLTTSQALEDRTNVISRHTGLFDLRGKQRTTITAEPSEAAHVALIFKRIMIRFFAYEEYCAKYETMVADMTSIHKSIPEWASYDSGIEALAKSVVSIDKRGKDGHKSLTVADLIIKPVQRICKYPLLLADLLKHTHVADCPESHTEIDRVLQRLRDMVQEINMATDDPYARDRMQRTWSLQERLIFPDEMNISGLFRILGHAVLVGVLHVAYQCKNKIQGEYMVSILFTSYLVLGVPANDQGKFDVVATIHLADLKTVSTEDGKGLQCHTALYSWKVVFESDNHLFELIFSACSHAEEDQWKRHISDRIAVVGWDFLEDHAAVKELFTTCSLDLSPAGEVFSQSGTLARKLSIQRAATVGTRSSVSQVIIRNTNKQDIFQEQRLPFSPSMNRSQSLLTTHRTPILAPKRSDRIRLEQSLSDIWTRDLLPFPGMLVARSGNHIRASAGSLVRKLSLASLHGPFTRRSSSLKVGLLRRSNETFVELKKDISEENASVYQSGSMIGPQEQDAALDDRASMIDSVPRSSRSLSERLRRRKSEKTRRRSKTVIDNAPEISYEKDVLPEGRREGKKRWSFLRNLSADGVRQLLYSTKAA